MKIFILRHGEAGAGVPDSERALTPRGAAQVRRLGQFLSGNPSFQPVNLLTSPYRRARETADQLIEAADARIASRLILGRLEPEMDPVSLLELFEPMQGDVLVVGHNPNLSILASLLMSGERARSRLRLETSEMIALDWHPIPNFGQTGTAELRWMIGPSLI